MHRAIDGGSPMSPVDFKKWQCPLSLFFLDFSVDFKIVQCHLHIHGETYKHIIGAYS